MGEVYDTTTITKAFAESVAKHGTRPFLAVPANAARGYFPEGFEITYIEAASQIAALSADYRAAGYGNGHRVALLLENRPEFFLHYLALNALGTGFVPINPDYRQARWPTRWTTPRPTWCWRFGSPRRAHRRGAGRRAATGRR